VAYSGIVQVNGTRGSNAMQQYTAAVAALGLTREATAAPPVVASPVAPRDSRTWPLLLIALAVVTVVVLYRRRTKAAAQ
jgi:hypothetical protein